MHYVNLLLSVLVIEFMILLTFKGSRYTSFDVHSVFEKLYVNVVDDTIHLIVMTLHLVMISSKILQFSRTR